MQALQGIDVVQGIDVMEVNGCLSALAFDMAESGWIATPDKGTTAAFFQDNMPRLTFTHKSGIKDVVLLGSCARFYVPSSGCTDFTVERFELDGSSVILGTKVYIHSGYNGKLTVFYKGMDIDNDCRMFKKLFTNRLMGSWLPDSRTLVFDDSSGYTVRLQMTDNGIELHEIMRRCRDPSHCGASEKSFVVFLKPMCFKDNLKTGDCVYTAFRTADLIFSNVRSSFCNVRVPDFDLHLSPQLILRVSNDRTIAWVINVDGAPCPNAFLFLLDEDLRFYCDSCKFNGTRVKMRYDGEAIGFSLNLVPSEIKKALHELKKLASDSRPYIDRMNKQDKQIAEDANPFQTEIATICTTSETEEAELLLEREKLAEQAANELLQEEMAEKQQAASKLSKKSRKKAARKRRSMQSMTSINEEEVCNADTNDTVENTVLVDSFGTGVQEDDGLAEFVSLRDLVDTLPEATEPTVADNEEVESSLGGQSTCIVCFSGAKTHVAIPCAHQIACQTCSEKLTKCPYCRADVSMWLCPRIV